MLLILKRLKSASDTDYKNHFYAIIKQHLSEHHKSVKMIDLFNLSVLKTIKKHIKIKTNVCQCAKVYIMYILYQLKKNNNKNRKKYII